MSTISKPVCLETPGYRGETEIRICHTTVPTMESDLAIRIMDHLAIATCVFDGEDTAGRQKLRLLSPQEVAARACDIAQAAVDQFQQRDWLLEVPIPKAAKLKDEL